MRFVWTFRDARDVRVAEFEGRIRLSIVNEAPMVLRTPCIKGLFEELSLLHIHRYLHAFHLLLGRILVYSMLHSRSIDKSMSILFMCMSTST